MGPRGLRVIKNAFYSFLTHTKQLLLVSFCDPAAGYGAASFQAILTEGRTDGWIDRRGN